MNLLERVVKIRTGGGVERCHGVRHHGSYSVAAHTWGALALLYVLYEEDFGRLAPALLFHDVPEAWVGDVPATTKRYSREVKTALSALEARIFALLDVPSDQGLPPEDAAKLEACDRLELYLWAREQVVEGNHHAQCVVRELDNFFVERQLEKRAHELYIQIHYAKPVDLQHATDRMIRELTRDERAE